MLALITVAGLTLISQLYLQLFLFINGVLNLLHKITNEALSGEWDMGTLPWRWLGQQGQQVTQLDTVFALPVRQGFVIYDNCSVYLNWIYFHDCLFALFMFYCNGRKCRYVKLMLLPDRHKVLNPGNQNVEPTVLPSVWEMYSIGHVTLH